MTAPERLLTLIRVKLDGGVGDWKELGSFIHFLRIGDIYVKTDKGLAKITDCKSQVDLYSAASPAS